MYLREMQIIIELKNVCPCPLKFDSIARAFYFKILCIHINLLARVLKECRTHSHAVMANIKWDLNQTRLQLKIDWRKWEILNLFPSRLLKNPFHGDTFFSSFDFTLATMSERKDAERMNDGKEFDRKGVWHKGLG